MRTLTFLVALVLATALLAAPAGAQRPPRAPAVALSATQTAHAYALPCANATFAATVRNVTARAGYVDVLIDAEAPLRVSRRVYSTWLPAGGSITFPVGISLADPGATGQRTITLRSGGTRTRVTVPVGGLPPGGNLLLYRAATASSSHPTYPPCRAVDGNLDSNDWDNGPGWNDGTIRVFPDFLDVRLDGPRTVGRVELHMLDSLRYPAARYGLEDWDVQLLVDGAWVTVDQVRDNVAGRYTSTFAPVTAEAIRIFVVTGRANYSRILELEAYER